MPLPHPSRKLAAVRIRSAAETPPDVATFVMGAGAFLLIAAILLYAVANLSH